MVNTIVFSDPPNPPIRSFTALAFKLSALRIEQGRQIVVGALTRLRQEAPVAQWVKSLVQKTWDDGSVLPRSSLLAQKRDLRGTSMGVQSPVFPKSLVPILLPLGTSRGFRVGTLEGLRNQDFRGTSFFY